MFQFDQYLKPFQCHIRVNIFIGNFVFCPSLISALYQLMPSPKIFSKKAGNGFLHFYDYIKKLKKFKS